MTFRRQSAVALMVLLAVGIIEPTSTSAVEPGCGAPHLVVVGAPAEDIGSVADAGAVTVLFDGAERGGALFTQESVGQVSERGDRFGAAVTTADVMADECLDLIVGVPGEDQGTGQVVIIPGSSAGLRPAWSVVLRQGTAGVAGVAEAGDSFGATLGVVHFFGDRRSLWVGAPFEDLGDAIDAGVVTRVGLDSPADLDTVDSVEYAQGNAGLPGTPETGDHFGATLAVNAHRWEEEFFRWIVIGAPGEDLGGVLDAGLVTLVPEPVGPNPQPLPAVRELTQDTPGVPGRAETGDRFGAVVTASIVFGCAGWSYPGIAIGAPGEDLGSVVNAGSVTYFPAPTGDGRLVVDAFAEPYDRFGSALQGFRYGLMIGTPRENVGSVNNAGAVTWLPMDCTDDDLSFFAPRVITQQTRGIPGNAERADAFGASLCCGTIVIGVPGESIGRVAATGAITVVAVHLGDDGSTPTLAGGRMVSQSSAGVPGASEPGDEFGAVLSRTAVR